MELEQQTLVGQIDDLAMSAEFGDRRIRFYDKLGQFVPRFGCQNFA